MRAKGRPRGEVEIGSSRVTLRIPRCFNPAILVQFSSSSSYPDSKGDLPERFADPKDRNATTPSSTLNSSTPSTPPSTPLTTSSPLNPNLPRPPTPPPLTPIRPPHPSPPRQHQASPQELLCRASPGARDEGEGEEGGLGIEDGVEVPEVVGA